MRVNQLEQVRDAALGSIVDALKADERFVAAWLAGSFGRGEEDAYSDLDLTLVVADEHAATLCATPYRTNAGTTPDRLKLISSIGTPAVDHEHHANAPAGGSFTAVVYQSGLAVDWTLVPEEVAARGRATKLLFDHANTPLEPPRNQPDADEITRRLAERHAFFWLLAVPAAKTWRRQDGVKFHAVLEQMHEAERDIHALLRGEMPAYSRESLAPFCATPQAQRAALIGICSRLNDLQGQLSACGVELSADPGRILDVWLEL